MEQRGRRPEHAHHDYLLPAVTSAVSHLTDRELLDLGCGTGLLTEQLRRLGFRAVGVEFTDEYVREAQGRFPEVPFVAHDLNDPLPDSLRGRFGVVTAIEVVEHLILPRNLFARASEALTPDGVLVITTPYHGWLKNVVIAATGQADKHYEPWVDYGHVKFFSRRTLAAMADECGFSVVDWSFVGRVKPLAKSMVMTACQHSPTKG